MKIIIINLFNKNKTEKILIDYVIHFVYFRFILKKISVHLIQIILKKYG